MKKIEFDELQQSRRYLYGYQSFILLLFLLLIDQVISGISTVWAQYPSHAMILVLAGCTYFISRCVWGDALVGPKETPRKMTVRAAIIVLIAVVAAIVGGLALVMSSNGRESAPSHGGGSSLFLYCMVMWAVIGIVYLIKRIRGNKEEN
jgi:hypothetical protein